MPDTEVRFDLRGTAAGQARLTGRGAAVIRYNPLILERHPEEFIAQTVAHEVAHVVAFTVFGVRIRPHGSEWRAIMQGFGAEPRRCHAYDVSRLRARALRHYPYRCGCGCCEISSIRHNRIRTRGIVYLCRRCHQPLRPATVHDHG
jgi:SprT protein